MSSSFQSIILKLQQFWSDHGCLITQPYYTQVGAGTMNPATFLRVLGPEPWNVAYVEPSVRPDDGRYGENPNRFQLHTQYQVILKPDPGNPQELYLASLEALGLGPTRLPTLGMTIYYAIRSSAILRGMWWWWGFPILTLVIIFLGLFLMATGLDEIANPRLRGAQRQ